MKHFSVVTMLFLNFAAAHAAAPAVLRGHEALALSPAGDRIVDVETSDPGNLPDEAHATVVVRNARGKILAQHDPCSACKYSDTAWSARGDAFAFVGADSKAGKTIVYLVANGTLCEVIAIEGTANTLRFSPDGARLALLATIGAHKKTGAIEAGAPLVGEIGVAEDEQRIAVLALQGDAHLEPVSPDDTYVYEFDWMPDGSGFVATSAHGNGDNNWWVAQLTHIDGTSGATRTIAAPAMQMDLPRVSPDGKTVAFVGGLMSDWGPIGGDIFTVPLGGGTPQNAAPDFRGSFRALAWRGTQLVAGALVDDRNAVVEVDPAAHTMRTRWSAPMRASAQDFDGSVVFDADRRVAATVVSDFTHAPEIALGTLDRLAVVTNDNAALHANVAAQSVHWGSDNFRAQGWLIGPRHVGAGKHPLLAIIHGGPSSAMQPRYVTAGGQYGTDFDFTYELIQRGYFVFYPNPRGSYGQGEAFTRANVRDFGGGDLRDILAGIDAVEKIAPIDDARIGAYGHSYGGWMTMWANTQTRRFKAIVSGAGIANWTSYYGQNGIDQWMIPFFGASVYDDPAVYRAASPIEFIKQAKTPTLIYVGERDVECPAPQSQEYWHALKALGTPTQLVIYAGEGHRFRDPKHLEDLRGRIVGWYERWLK
jgi:dipeptidyl aminopeptidase/acylaminoacyl peptidase